MYHESTVNDREYRTEHAMTNWDVLLPTLERHLKDTRSAYNNGMPGVTVEDMRASARRLLTMRRTFEKMSGKKVKSDPNSKAQIAALLR